MNTPENNALTLAMVGKDDAEHLLALDELSCRLERERNDLRSAIRNLRDVKGRHHSEQAYTKLVAILPESKGDES